MEKKKGIKNKMFEIQQLRLKFPKTATGFHENKFVPLDELWDKLVPELDSRELLVTHRAEKDTLTTYVTDLESGEEMYSAILFAEKLEPQKMGSAITYYRRYNLNSLFNLMTENDDDGNKASGNGVTDRNDAPNLKDDLTDDNDI